jgi:hypothetical protein
MIPRNSMRRILLAFVVPGLLLGAVILSRIAETDAPVRMGGFPAQPIPGMEVSLGQAEAVAGSSLPELPPAVLSDVCSGVSFPVERLAVWASTGADKGAQLGETYSHGIWMSLTPVSDYRPSTFSGDELRPVEDAFSPDDFPKSLATVSVRGHLAWGKEVNPSVRCLNDTVTDVPVRVDAGSIVPGVSRLAVMFNPTLNGNLTWSERGYVVEIAGLFSMKQLQELAEKMTW